MGSVMVGTDWHHAGNGTLLLLIVTMLIGVISSTAQSVDNDGICSHVERSTVTFQETYQVSRSHKSYRKCGFLNWVRCTQYSVTYTTETRVAYKDSYNIVFTCCIGWIMQNNGSCQQNTSEVTTQSQPTDPLAPSETYGTTVLIPKWSPSPSSSSPSPVPSTVVFGSSPENIAKPDGPRTLGKGGQSLTDSEGERIGMIGGLVGVAVAVIAMVSLIIIFVSRRRRRTREKRRCSDPGVAFQLLNSISPSQAPVPDIYAEIPDRDGNANSPSAPSNNTAPKDSFDDYDIAFTSTKQTSGLANTYQDPKEAGSHRPGPGEASVRSPAMKKTDTEITLGPNGVVYTKTHKTEKGEEVVPPYQNLPRLDTVINPPDIYDTVGGNEDAPAAFIHPYGANAIPTDPDDETYNMIVIGQTNSKKGTYDKLERQSGSSRISGDDQLDTPIPAASGYSALGLDNHLGYDKLERHENHGIDSDKKTSTAGPNTYDELSAQGRSAEYDKLTRRGSADHGLKDSGNKNNGTKSGVPNGSLVGNQYDTIEVKRPIDGDIYENLPKKPYSKGLAVKLPGPQHENQEHAWSPDANLPISTLLSSPVVRPVYDVIPKSQRMPTAPVYDIVPKSPGPTGGAPVYDTPPAVTKLMQQGSIDQPINPVVGGARPVYDTPPVRSDRTCPLQIEETCPLYENTPTGRM